MMRENAWLVACTIHVCGTRISVICCGRTTGPDSSNPREIRHRPRGGTMTTMRIYRDIATLAGAQILCFFLLSHLEPSFFLLHFYQTIIYLAVLVLLFYMEDRWAYMIGLLAPAAWLVLAFSTG